MNGTRSTSISAPKKGIVNGFEDGTFRPTGYLRRSEFIKMLATSASLTYKSELPGKHWAEAYWAMLSENGVLEGLDIPARSTLCRQRPRAMKWP